MASILALAAGCSDAPYEIVPISGKVTYEDGSLIPAEAVLVQFYPQVDPLEPSVHARPGIAQLNPEDGSFAYVSTCERGDGVVLGPHKVTVKVDDESPTGAGSVPEVYSHPATTPLEIEVTRRGEVFELTIEKPTGATKRE